ncbi:MAG: hypothetical protein II160_06990 [Selenomonas sp.]|nr:hypothetical protein [Selenomonas sp.]
MAQLRDDQMESTICGLRELAQSAFARGKIDLAMQAISANGLLSYTYNQWYTDDSCEQIMQQMAAQLPAPGWRREESQSRTVIFYDSFGLDTRGLALIYLQALASLGYHVVYITYENDRGHQPQVQKELQAKDVVWHYLPRRCARSQLVSQIVAIFEQERPAHAFFYCMPDDVQACVAFAHYAGLVTRYQINLTDHAFWLGKCAFDYCLEFRDYGARVSIDYRGIRPEQLVVLPYYPYADLTMPFAGFPFPRGDRKVVFSGGSLYKTMDEERSYYKMIDALLTREQEAVFLYAGAGDDSGLRWLQERHDGRVVHIAERRDLLQLMEQVDLYINTYPMIGGLMTQYAARAGIPPLTLQHTEGETLDGLLFGYADLKLEFQTPEKLLDEAHHLLSDAAYAAAVSARIKQCVISPERFAENVRLLLTKHRTEFAYHYAPIDTTAFTQDYVTRLSPYACADVLASRNNSGLWRYFPRLFLKGAGHKIVKKLQRACKQ